MASYTDDQKEIFLLSMASGLGADLKASSEEELESELIQRLDQCLPEIGAWTRVWGPVVYIDDSQDKEDEKVADNVMYAARKEAESSRPPLLVIAIAGTNMASIFDLKKEDFDISQMVDWDTGSAPTGAKISKGTSRGFEILKSMKSQDRTIDGFLSAQTKAAAVDVTVTGHSLGGALAPTLALWLSDTRSSWDQRGDTSLACQPSAGPTPGNGVFASYYDDQLRDRTTRIWNSSDVVPHVWATSDLEAVKTIYPCAPTPEVQVAAIDIISMKTKSLDYTQILEDTDPLAGSCNDDCSNDFAGQLAYQHTTAYYNLIFGGTSEIPSLLSNGLAQCPRESA